MSPRVQIPDCTGRAWAQFYQAFGSLTVIHFPGENKYAKIKALNDFGGKIGGC